MTKAKADAPLMTDEEAAEVTRRLAIYNQGKLAEQQKAEEDRRAAREALMGPVRDLVGSAAFTEVMERVAEILPDYADVAPINGQLRGLAEIMPQLKDWAAK